MLLIEWKDEFSLGIPSVDHEHRELIDIINELYAKLPEEHSKDLVMDFLGELHAKIASHFALEEKIMIEKNYDKYEDHKADHERLLDELRTFMDEYENDEKFSEHAFGKFLEYWFIEHFRTKDARLHKRLG